MWKETAMAKLEELPGGIDETTKNFNLSGMCPFRDSNLSSTEQKSEALLRK
jgi:hypothetical protein